ncbi:MAG: efflux RND transporter periplasmic adaptor subunit [Gammaproteobacteria bacterium]|nr:efflux RND transporter periplasmic adaptor subunit [Gammaproteobacteria bacterium]MBU1645031.1 efflux RND transporter periplasmic adaptor subunit [Gammaproteobacteria bacterium]MBU1973268.1 efflux RND transporter periplasmic adaptor subunit [Gammaproteobacteria bacterium]
MKLLNTLAFGLVAGIAAGTGYWAGTHQNAMPPGTIEKVGASGTASSGEKPAQPDASTARKLLYYRNPMGLPDTSPTPKKDSMGMDYIPVYEGGDDGDDGNAGSVRISTAKVQKLGVRTELAALRDLSRPLRAAGRVEVDERRLFAVAPKFEGWVERLHVNTTGQPVARGQVLFEAYSPELVSAQREYQVAARGLIALKDASPEAQASIRQVADASLARLANWDISAEQIAALSGGGEARRTLSYRAPVSGVVLEKKAVQGMRFMPGEALYQIADISNVWVLADVFERDIAAVKVGQKASVTLTAFPDRVFEGRVGYVYPTLNPQTRTVPVRVELANPGGLLRPAMYANVEVKVGASGTAQVVTVPLSAVIDSGTRQTVLVQKGEGRYEPREVKLGMRGDDHVEVREGVAAGEPVVVVANFLIDSESNLKAALGGMQEAPKAAVGHQAVGTLDAVDAAAGTVTVTHEPVASLKWPAMTMEFVPANPALVADFKPGAPISFEFVERKPGEWVITKLEARKR